MTDNKKLSSLDLGVPGNTTRVYGIVDALTTPASKYFNWPGQGINVKDYGAVGDGVTDDTAAILSVASAIGAMGGGSVYFPKGTYNCTAKVTWPYNLGNILIFGDGASSVIYYSAEDGTDCWKIPQFNTNGAILEKPRFIIRDLAMRGAGKLKTTGNGLVIFNTFGVSLDSLSISGFGGGAGILNQGGQSVGLYRTYCEENKYGLHLRDTGTADPGDVYNLNSNNVAARDCHFQHSVSHGVYLEKPTGLTRVIQTLLDNCIIQGNAGSGVYADDFSFLTIKNAYFEVNQTGGVSADIYAVSGYWLTVENCESHSGSGTYVSVDITDVSNGLFRDNSFVKSFYRANSTYIKTYQADFSGITDTGYYSLYIQPPVDANFADGDATPNVSSVGIYNTVNTSPTTITFFDNGRAWQRIIVRVLDNNTTFDFSGGNLVGNESTDYTAKTYDMIDAVFDGAKWYCTIIKR